MYVNEKKKKELYINFTPAQVFNYIQPIFAQLKKKILRISMQKYSSFNNFFFSLSSSSLQLTPMECIIMYNPNQNFLIASTKIPISSIYITRYHDRLR